MLGDDLACVRIDTGRYSHIVYPQDTVIFSYVSFMEVYLLLQIPNLGIMYMYIIIIILRLCFSRCTGVHE